MKYAIEILTKKMNTHLFNAQQHDSRAKAFKNSPGLLTREEIAVKQNKEQAEQLRLAIVKLQQ